MSPSRLKPTAAEWLRYKTVIRRQVPEYLQERFAILVYNVSNRKWDLGRADDEWDAAVTLLCQSGLLRHRFDATSFGHWTMLAFMENMFHLWVDYLDMSFDAMVTKVFTDSARDSGVLEWLILSGVDVKSDRGKDALHFCIMDYFPRCTRLLLKAGVASLAAPPEEFLEKAFQAVLYREGNPSLEILHHVIQHSHPTLCHEFLGKAIAAGSIEIITSLLKEGENLPPTLPGGGSPEHSSASHSGDTENEPLWCWPEAREEAKVLATALLRVSRDILVVRYPSRSVASFITPKIIIYVAQNGPSFAFKALSEIVDDIGATDSHGYTLLHAAAYWGDGDICDILLQHGVPINTPSSPITPLHLAVLLGNYITVDLLIENGAEVDAIGTLDIDAHTGPSWSEEHEKFGRCCDVTALEALVQSKALYNVPTYADRFLRWSNCISSLFWAGASLPRGTLVACIRCGCVEIASAMLAAGGDPNETHEGRSALQWAVCSHKALAADLTQLLLDAGARPRGDEAITALTRSLPDVVRVLWRYKMLLPTQTDDGTSALRIAALTGGLETIKTVMGYHAHIYDDDCLYSSIQVGAPLSLIETLLRNRPADAAPTTLEASAMLLAVDIYQYKPGYLDLLLSLLPLVPEGLKPNRGWRFYGYSLWDHESSNRESHFFLSPLAHATDNRCQAAIDKLLENGYRLDWHTLVVVARQDFCHLAQEIIQSEPSVYENLWQRQCSPLVAAVSVGSLDVVRLLLSAGIPPEGLFAYETPPRGPPDRRLLRRSPLQLAIEKGQLDIINALLEAGADVNEPPDCVAGATALQIAAYTGNLGIAKHLITLGADVNSRRADSKGRTALEGASEHGRLDMTQLLLSDGVKTTGSWRRQYVRAVRFAKNKGNSVVESLLRAHREWTPEDEYLWQQDGLLSEEGPWLDESEDCVSNES